jgi:hypothetical protein
MGSIATNINIVSKSGEKLPESAFAELRSRVKGEVVIKGEAEEDVFRAAIDRYNKASISEAVRIILSSSNDY